MDKLSQISIENTVSVKVDCILNQDLLAKNFGIIMNCLKDLKSQQDMHSASLNQFSNLKDLFDKLKQQVNNKTVNNNNNDTTNQSKQIHSRKSSSHLNNQKDKNLTQFSDSFFKDLQKQIDELKTRVSKNEGFTIQNTKDIGLLNKQLKQTQQQVEKLKKLIQNLDSSKNNSNSSLHNLNLSKNQSLQQQSINNLSKSSQDHENRIKKLEKQMQDMKQMTKKLDKELDTHKNDFDLHTNEQTSNNKQSNQSNNQIDLSPIDSKSLSDIMKKLDQLSKKTQSLQSQSNNHTKNINDLHQNTEKNSQSIQDINNNINGIHEQIKQINTILEQFQNVHNQDITNLNNQLDKLRQKIEKLMKMIKQNNGEGSKNKNNSNNKNQNDSSFEGSNKNIHKVSNGTSFKRRSDSTHKEDLSGKINQINTRLIYLQKLFSNSKYSQENPQKLPSISKKQNATFYNGQKSSKKQIADMKSDLQIWIKAYLASLKNNNNNNTEDWQLKIQQIKNVVARKADHEGMKKGLAFLQGKITQLYLFLTQPDAQDAMIVRKGFNCLSCSKKVETLRGKLGPRMNWDNLNANNHTPPKQGFNKYADSAEKESI